MTLKKTSGKDKALPVHKNNGGKNKPAPRPGRGKDKSDLQETAPFRGKVDRKEKKTAPARRKNADKRPAEKPVRADNAARTERPRRGEKAPYAAPAGRRKKASGAKVLVIPLGGLGEIGKNMTAVECGERNCASAPAPA